jgi:SAM-dependent methyltransferase
MVMANKEVKMLWDNRYTDGLPSLLTPDPFFVEMYEQHIPTPGSALDLAAGLGRHTTFLAERDWQVTAVDISSVAMEQLAAKHLPNITTVISDIDEYEITGEYDLIVLFYHFDRALFPKIYASLKQGGLLLCKLAVSYKPSVAPLQKNEFLSLVPEYKLITHQERPVKERGVVEYLGQKI